MNRQPNKLRTFESLEQRDLPAADFGAGAPTAALFGNVLEILGNQNHNSVQVERRGNGVNVHIDSTSASGLALVGSQVDFFFQSAAAIQEIRFWGNDGNDSFVSELDLRTQLVGGAGNDTLIGNNSEDAIWGDTGDDVLIGLGGNDYFGDAAGRNEVLGGAGRDTAYFGTAGSKVFDVEDFQFNVPGGNPQGRNTCGPNSAWRMMTAYGGVVTDQQLINATHRSERLSGLVSQAGLGTTGQVLVDAMNANRRGLSDVTFKLSLNKSVDNLIDQLEKGGPVVALIGTQPSERVVEGTAGQIVDRVVGGRNNRVYGIPKLHWITVTGFNSQTNTIYYTDTDGGSYQTSKSSFGNEFNWRFDSAWRTILGSVGVRPGTFIYANASLSSSVDLVRSADKISSGAAAGLIERLGTPGLAGLLPQLPAHSVRTITDQMTAAQLQEVLRLLPGNQQANILAGASAAQLAEVAEASTAGFAADFVRKLSDSKAAAVLNRVNGATLGGLTEKLSVARLAEILPRVKDATLREAMNSLNADRAARLLARWDGDDIRAATNLMGVERLRDALDEMNGDQLTKVAKHTAAAKLADVADASSAGLAVSILRRLSVDRAAKMLDRVNGSALNGIVDKLATDRLAAILEKSERSTVRAAVDRMSDKRLAAVYSEANSATRKTIWDRADKSTRNYLRKHG